MEILPVLVFTAILSMGKWILGITVVILILNCYLGGKKEFSKKPSTTAISNPAS